MWSGGAAAALAGLPRKDGCHWDVKMSSRGYRADSGRLMKFLLASWTCAERICPSRLVVKSVIRPSSMNREMSGRVLWTTSPMQGGGTVADGRVSRGRCVSRRLVR